MAWSAEGEGELTSFACNPYLDAYRCDAAIFSRVDVELVRELHVGNLALKSDILHLVTKHAVRFRWGGAVRRWSASFGARRHGEISRIDLTVIVRHALRGSVARHAAAGIA